jgi:type I restriction enzyme, S subunit
MNKTSIGTSFKVVGGGTPSTSIRDYWNGDIPWITSADIDDKLNLTPRKFITNNAISNSATNLVPTGSIIVVTRVGLGKVAIAPFDLCFSQDCQALLVDKSKYDSKYIALQLKKIVGIFKHISRGTTISGVTKNQLLGLEIINPPIDEQQRIVAEIEKQFTRLDAGVAALKRLQINLKRYRAAVLKAACEGKLVPTEAELTRKEGREYEPASVLLERILKERREKWLEQNPKKKYVEPKGPDTSNLPVLPEGWCWAKLNVIADIIGGYAFESKKFSRAGYQILKMANIRMGQVDLSQKASFISDVNKDVVEKYKLKAGDIVVTLTGTRKKRDYGYIAEIKKSDNLLLNQRIARLRPYKGIIPSYLQIIMQSESYQNRFFHHETGIVGQGNVGISAVTDECIALAPLSEQRRIVLEIERIQSIINEIESNLEINMEKAERLRQAVLQRAFEGRFPSATLGERL